eukprot:CAMPEP_0115659158 /NCGR_PEP_ID=MMETSP0272-20121206/45579_1 /TAXON_ID=71861 /ORGANISM="Scrippsiella trochoidea, Strain CCMP3099" /LENGTH=264 /DNA_ID=CAMNT_0003097263 /DNA_START=1 /DNA_END=796 /DNA_ORIENTATION=+
MRLQCCRTKIDPNDDLGAAPDCCTMAASDGQESSSETSSTDSCSPDMAPDGFSRYWICAFCVNQHASICSGFPPAPPESTAEYQRWDTNRRDTVTGEIHKVCRCGEPKRIGSSWSDRSELNKFDEMMELMQQAVPGLRQTIAIDVDLGIFTRVWCVAELVQASASGMPQDACLLQQALDVNRGDAALYARLATLTVGACSATCPEDKDRILAKIPDLSQFDAQLQALIFGSAGLIGKHLVGFDVLYTAARTAFRMKLAAAMLDV